MCHGEGAVCSASGRAPAKVCVILGTGKIRRLDITSQGERQPDVLSYTL